MARDVEENARQGKLRGNKVGEAGKKGNIVRKCVGVPEEVGR